MCRGTMMVILNQIFEVTLKMEITMVVHKLKLDLCLQYIYTCLYDVTIINIVMATHVAGHAMNYVVIIVWAT